MNPPLSFLWKHLKALYTKFVERVRHCAGNHGFHSKRPESHEPLGYRTLGDLEVAPEEDEEAFWFMVFSEEMFD